MAYYDLQTNMVLQADDFFEAYKRCLECKNWRKDEYGRNVADIDSIPAIVNGAFACELYIKSLLPTQEKEHNLKLLFEMLPPDFQESIRNEVNDKFKDYAAYTFDMRLDDSANAFINWRYIHEEEHTEGYMGCYVNELPTFFGYLLPILQRLAKSNLSE